MARIEGVAKVIAEFSVRAKTAQNVTVIVGFTQSYAIYVHENMQAKHPVGQAKFLEQPLRTMGAELQQIVATAMKAGATLLQGLLLAGLRLQREAQLLTPVDTGALRASAFTREEK